MKSIVVRAALGLSAVGLSGVAFGQAVWTPGSELIGQPIQVTTNGTTNTVYLDAGGQLRVVTPNGTTMPGTWQAASGQLCLGMSGATECVPYKAAFQPQQPQTLTSSCGAQQTWLAQATNQPPSQGQRGERGR
jgi:hypothetical protein